MTDYTDDIRARRSLLIVAGCLDVAEAIAAAHCVTLGDVLSLRRDPSTVRARHALWHLLLEKTGWSHNGLAKRWDAHHTTILYGVGRHRRRLGIVKEDAA